MDHVLLPSHLRGAMLQLDGSPQQSPATIHLRLSPVRKLARKLCGRQTDANLARGIEQRKRRRTVPVAAAVKVRIESGRMPADMYSVSEVNYPGRDEGLRQSCRRALCDEKAIW